MSKQYSASADKVNAQNEITQKIVNMLEQGVRPWSKSWTGTGMYRMSGLPKRASGENYSGINILLLWLAMQDNGWENPYFMTYDQAVKLGGCVRKGSKGTKIVYYSSFTKEEEHSDGSTDTSRIAFMKFYTVFSVEQIDGIPERFYKKAEQPSEEQILERVANADQFFNALGVRVKEGGNSAFYNPGGDFVGMPAFNAFQDAQSYYCTLGHEMTHATGHASRCNRELTNRFGNAAYAFEELIAELGAAFLAAELGIDNEPREDHASYIKSWVKILKDDSKAIFTAASMASKAVAWMRDHQIEESMAA
jgi:antirestriction protein ArdC